ncbi:spermidine/putrescine import ATP-binding protein PotA [bacterium BMS3Bbin10]|nr:spermidine/putrescine import ATP-binding protein PotA [bacterium BMS3Bbin10]
MSDLKDQGTAINLLSCAKTFAGGVQALEPLDLEIAGGETVVLLGPSGCGKTTTLRIIAGLEEPDPGGRVMFGDDDVTRLPIEKRKIGMVFQSYALFPNMTVRENIAYGLMVRRMPKPDIDRRVGEMLEMMHIGDLEFRRIDQLSGGQCQRVALARAIAVQPRVLLLDEPLTALDAILRTRLRVEIDQLLRRLGITAVYVTHDQGEAMSLGDRIVVMSRGRVEQIGTPRDIYYKPNNDFVAEFIGTINRLRGIARGDHVEVAGASLPWSANRSGGEVEILFRPENVTISNLKSAHLKGNVVTSFFQGDRTKLILDGLGERQVIIETTDRVEFIAGQEIGFRIDPDSMIILNT